MDVVVVPVGGGGLISGIATALPGVRVVGVEPVLSNCLTAALEAGSPVPVKPTSIADGLNAPFAGTLPLRDRAGARRSRLSLVEEEEIEAAMRFLYERAKLACEPAGAVGRRRAPGRQSSPHEQGETVVCVVSGGNVSAETAAAILARQ